MESGDDEAVTLTSPHGYAQINTVPAGDGRWVVRQHGHRLWDTAEHALHAWADLGRPDRTRYGISALDNVDRQYVWLDTQDGPHAWPMPL